MNAKATILKHVIGNQVLFNLGVFQGFCENSE